MQSGYAHAPGPVRLPENPLYGLPPYVTPLRPTSTFVAAENIGHVGCACQLSVPDYRRPPGTALPAHVGARGRTWAHVSLAGTTIVGMPDAPIQHAFVSYVREDADEVGKLVSILQAASIPVWKDTENLWPGEDWQQKIREAVEDGALAFIACFSTSSAQKAKTYMNAELRLAVDQIRLMKPGQVWLLPVRLDDCDLPDFDLGNNRTLNSLQRIDLFGANRDENLGRLISAVMKIFGTSTTTSASVAAAIAGSGNSERGPLLAEALKTGIGDPSRQMELEDLFLDEVRTTLQALKGDARFPATGGPSPTITSLVERAQEYDALIEPLAHAAITLGAWGDESHATLVARAMKSLAATSQDLRGGSTAYLTLRTYPVLLLIYAGALGAVARSNGRMLAAFTTDPNVAIDGRALALPVAITPRRPFADTEGAASVLARIALEGGTVEQYAGDAQQGKLRYYTPLSEYLFAHFRPLAESLVLDESEYEQLFHRTEALIALAELDWMASNTDVVNDHRRSWSRWMGRGIHRTNYYLVNNVTLGHDLLGEIKSKQKAWWPVAGGMFGGDYTRAEAAAVAYIEYETQERRHRWYQG